MGASGPTRHGQGQWTGPQVGEPELDVRVLQEHNTVARSEQAVVKVRRLRRYVDGCAVDLDATAITGDVPAGEFLRSAAQSAASEPAPTLLQFRAQLPDGQTASTLDHVVMPSSAPGQPYVTTLGGPGYKVSDHRLDTEFTLWLWQQPSPEQFELVVGWPSFAISEQRISLTTGAD